MFLFAISHLSRSINSTGVFFLAMSVLSPKWGDTDSTKKEREMMEGGCYVHFTPSTKASPLISCSLNYSFSPPKPAVSRSSSTTKEASKQQEESCELSLSSLLVQPTPAPASDLLLRATCLFCWTCTFSCLFFFGTFFSTCGLSVHYPKFLWRNSLKKRNSLFFVFKILGSHRRVTKVRSDLAWERH